MHDSINTWLLWKVQQLNWFPASLDLLQDFPGFHHTGFPPLLNNYKTNIVLKSTVTLTAVIVHDWWKAGIRSLRFAYFIHCKSIIGSGVCWTWSWGSRFLSITSLSWQLFVKQRSRSVFFRGCFVDRFSCIVWNYFRIVEIMVSLSLPAVKQLLLGKGYSKQEEADLLTNIYNRAIKWVARDETRHNLHFFERFDHSGKGELTEKELYNVLKMQNQVDCTRDEVKK